VLRMESTHRESSVTTRSGIDCAEVAIRTSLRRFLRLANDLDADAESEPSTTLKMLSRVSTRVRCAAAALAAPVDVSAEIPPFKSATVGSTPLWSNRRAITSARVGG